MPPIRTSSTPFAPLIALGPQPAPTHAAIAECAYYKYLASGAHPGRCERNWLDAELELTRRLGRPSVAAAAAVEGPGESVLKDILNDAERPFRGARRISTD